MSDGHGAPGDGTRPEAPTESAADGLAVLAIGEILWDLLPSGPRLGGAPFNVVAHLHRLGHPAAYLTAVGGDDLGRRTIAELRELGVLDALVEVVPGATTGTVGVALDAHGSPTFEIRSPAAYELTDAPPEVIDQIRRLDPRAIVFGTLAQRCSRVRVATQRVLRALPTSLRVYDVNLRADAWTPALVGELAAEADVLKLNDDEMRTLGPTLGLPANPPSAFAAAAAQRFDLTAVCVTAGAAGALLWTPVEVVRDDGYSIAVADTVGAGDAFTAALVHGLLSGMAARETLAVANALGAIVASQRGAIPPWTQAQLRALRDSRTATLRREGHEQA